MTANNARDDRPAHPKHSVPVPDGGTIGRGADDLRRRTEAEGRALHEAEKHRPEPGGCTCGFCVWSVEHVLIMSLRAAMAHV